MRHVVYICNPELNTECNHICCGLMCHSTKNKKYAKLDKRGRPIENLSLHRSYRKEVRTREKIRRKYVKGELKPAWALELYKKWSELKTQEERDKLIYDFIDKHFNIPQKEV